VAKSYFVGYSVDEFKAKIERHGLPSNAMKSCAELICADMELTIKNVVETCEPIVGDADMFVKSLATTVPAGKLIGCTGKCEIETEQSIKIDTFYKRTCYKKGQHDINTWVIRGYPDTFIENMDPPTNVATSSTTVNRIPDVINADPGFITCEKLPKLRYRTYPLHYYLKPR
jgi:4-hydroxy-tetrahydrodipicolinate reductase